ncbi:N-6 DNA methylase [Brevundimonas aurantiaca]|uniref:Type I restriction enzyme M protein n=1 Tax=Brevundimonas aurantiaca TaxID=74316 RepID=A0A7W9F9X3_9CAUL|nr:N-6 DNA methylase [Brevundimonas aurantiaca]MBB5741490.1 type I restriction enzyme M protein [Brevundimonas aurantiaca]
MDFITGRLMNDTPEEYVRQNVEQSLILEYGYHREQVEVEFPIKVGSGKKRVDLAIFAVGASHTQDNIQLIIETKREGTKRDDRNDGVGQLKSYMASSVNCQYGMWTNGIDRDCLFKSVDAGQHVFLDAIDIPTQGAKKADAPTREYLRAATGQNLLFTFKRCHNYIAGSVGLQKPDAFWELLKLIFCKIEDERSDNEKLEFYVTQSERSSMDLQGRVKARLDRVFRDLVLAKYPTIFKPNEQLEMSGATLAYVVSEMQQYSLLDSPVDVKGIAYEEVVGSNLRGDRGEFFTPRNACRMAVQMINPQANEVILDPSCGTGGFLVTAMNHVLSNIDRKHKNRWSSLRPSPEQQAEWYRERHNYLSNNIYGLDLNPSLVRAAKMNMVMNNDGSGKLFQCNSLEHPHRWPAEGPPPSLLGSVDIIFANPPFGTEITIDDPRILAQYEVGGAWEKTESGFQRRLDRKGEPVLQSSQSPEVLFVERCLQFLKPGGRMAIVLPNGLLNNPGLAYFRQSILRQAQLLAVVDMHRDLFQPRNDTQTSMVLLRKWSEGETAASHGDYPIYMAIADKIGHDKRGNTLNKRAPDGSLLLEHTSRRHRVPGPDGTFEEVEVHTSEAVVDDDLDDIAAAYHAWLTQQMTPARGRGAQGPAT